MGDPYSIELLLNLDFSKPLLAEGAGFCFFFGGLVSDFKESATLYLNSFRLAFVNDLSTILSRFTIVLFTKDSFSMYFFLDELKLITNQKLTFY